MGKQIGVLGGSFDPIHNGHLNLAFELMEKRGLDEVWFVPAYISPHKVEAPPTSSPEHRLEMLKIALQDIPQFHVKEIEYQLPPPSYTVNTLRHILKENPKENQFYLLMGEDSISGFYRWFQPEEIVQLVPLLIGSRSGTWPLEKERGMIKEAIQKGLTKTRLMDISSTELRERLSQGLYCQHLIPSSVLEYISNHHLYE